MTEYMQHVSVSLKYIVNRIINKTNEAIRIIHIAGMFSHE